ncbi:MULTISPECIES: ionic transporter y4hA [unclassified Sphingomonas]|uniref:calcium:proton antiporter n=1 Tax=unclassified Sphingomonas TaxID=196159 RepID=UPI00092A8BB9|nr:MULTISPECIES: ionic transporter y4hA [unclassified Sphingomonas]MBN8846836.1 ionic transporter y4hA [Sphingomonas sp.]OJV33775.1 MAG: ionic transporter y4hA [Sphingomonas sp. 67-36]
MAADDTAGPPGAASAEGIGLPWWSIAFPLLALAAVLVGLAKMGTIGVIAAAVMLVGSVLAAVHHAEVVAHKVGEPFGTLVLAVAVTVIEVSLIVSLMLSDAGDASTLARDTVFAAIMIILNGIVGICLLAGGVEFREQSFTQTGVSAALNVLVAMSVLTLVLPNFVESAPGPVYAPSQLVFVAIVSLILYGTFVLVQTVRHRSYFLPEDGGEDEHADAPTARTTWVALAILLVALIGVVLLAKGLAATVERAVLGAGLPLAVVGVVIAALVLAPESVAAFRAARRDRLQTSLNLALGSALASIGLTIPSVAVVSLLLGLPLALGIGAKSLTLLILSLFSITLSLGTGRTTILGGVVHLVIFAVYLFVTVVP